MQEHFSKFTDNIGKIEWDTDDESGLPIGVAVGMRSGEGEHVPFVTEMQCDGPVEEWLLELMGHVDSFIPTPKRETEKDFVMPVEDTFSIAGRGTVVTGRIESGVIKPGEEIEIVGLRKTQKTTVTGVEMFHKLLESGEAGDNVGCLLRGLKRDDVQRGLVLLKVEAVLT